MEYRVFGIEMRHIAICVEADSKEDAARKGYQSFKAGDDSIEQSHDDHWYDEEVEVAPYVEEDNDYDLTKAEILSGT